MFKWPHISTNTSSYDALQDSEIHTDCRSVCRHFLTGLSVQNETLTSLGDCWCSVINAQVASHRREMYRRIFSRIHAESKTADNEMKKAGESSDLLI